jgi:preprotein translocase subunit SecA
MIKKIPPKSKKEIVPIEPEYLKVRLVREIDNFWSEYLESLNKIRILVNVKVYLPQEPQEAFF